MTRRAFLLAPFLLPARAEAAGVHVTGTLGGEHVTSGYFELTAENGQSDHDLTIATPPGSVLYPHCMAMHGRTVQFSLFTVAP